MALEEFQFELDGITFGHGADIFVDQDGFDPGDPEWITQDRTNPITGATMMGRDVRKPSDWNFIMHVNGTDPLDALNKLAVLGAKWANGADGWQSSRSVMALRYNIGGRIRRVYGRPRRFSAKPNNKILGGYLPPVATFARADSLHYDDFEQSSEIAIAATPPGGLEFPADFPLDLAREPSYVPPGSVVVGGDAPTAPVVTFTGPVIDPVLTVGDFVLGLVGELPADATITVDARPWSMNITRTGAAEQMTLSRDTRLARAGLKPGSYQATFTGVSASGAARARVAWRNAWHTL